MFYEAVQKSRYFNRDDKYSDINWTDFKSIVNAFEKRIDDWYFNPIKVIQKESGHYAFTALALECLLIDTISQFEQGELSSSRSIFKSFVKRRLKPYGTNLKYPIKYEEVKKKGVGLVVTVKQYSDRAEVLYHGFRCGILHQAHAPLFCSVDPGGARMSEIKGGKVKYSSDQSDCPSVKINPWKLATDLDDAFRKYLKQLKANSTRYDTLRKNFITKFSDCFGVDISSATL